MKWDISLQQECERNELSLYYYVTRWLDRFYLYSLLMSISNESERLLPGRTLNRSTKDVVIKTEWKKEFSRFHSIQTKIVFNFHVCPTYELVLQDEHTGWVWWGYRDRWRLCWTQRPSLSKRLMHIAERMSTKTTWIWLHDVDINVIGVRCGASQEVRGSRPPVSTHATIEIGTEVLRFFWEEAGGVRYGWKLPVFNPPDLKTWRRPWLAFGV